MVEQQIDNFFLVVLVFVYFRAALIWLQLQ